MRSCEYWLKSCCRAMRQGKDKKICKYYYDKAWQARVNEGCNNPVINEALDWMQGNFYPDSIKGRSYMSCSDYGDYYEGRILARSESDCD